MAYEKDKKELKKIFPHRYATFLETELRNRNITQQNGKPFLNQYIQLWFRDRLENIILNEAVRKIAKEIEEGTYIEHQQTVNS